MAPKWENPPDADVILRASGEQEFHAHKLILSLASPVFRDMFSVPQPPSAESSELPVVDVSDPAGALKIFLEIIYPTCDPHIDDVAALASVIQLADKYNAKGVLGVHKDHLPQMRSNPSPIEMYAILCACDREEEAGAAARCISFASLKSLHSSPLLQLITTTQYQRLASFMAVRDEAMREIVGEHHKAISMRSYPCNDDPAHRLYSSTIVASLQAAFEADPCVRVVEALGIVSSAHLTFTPCGERCRYNMQGLRECAEGLLKALVEMAEGLQWDSFQYVYLDDDDHFTIQGRGAAQQCD